jgi:hypothetical protein
VCNRALAAARPLLGARTVLRITGRDPANIECRISGAGIHLDVNAQASPRAWAQFDTVLVHEVQGTPPTNAKNPALPIDIPGPNSAAWIPANSQFVTTNGTQSKAGSYVTVNVTRRSRRGPSSLKAARTVAEATLAAAPRGPSPGPPPS